MLLLLFFYPQTWYFYHKAHIKWDVIISSSLRLLLKMWIWYRCQNRIENYYLHDKEQLGFYKKVHSKHREKCSCNLYIARNEEFQFIWQNCTQEDVKCHIQYEESWRRRIVIEQVNYYFPLIFPERNGNRDVF